MNTGRIRSIPLNEEAFKAAQLAVERAHKLGSYSPEHYLFPISDRQAKLTVRDFGHGMPVDLRDGLAEGHTRLGVGLSGMRERVKDLGGQLNIRSDQKGTTLVVTVPVGGTAAGSTENPDWLEGIFAAPIGRTSA